MQCSSLARGPNREAGLQKGDDSLMSSDRLVPMFSVLLYAPIHWDHANGGGYARTTYETIHRRTVDYAERGGKMYRFGTEGLKIARDHRGMLIAR